MNRFIRIGILGVLTIGIGGSVVGQICDKAADKDDRLSCVDHMIEEDDLGEVREFKGQLFFPNGEFVPDGMVEIYAVTEDLLGEGPYFAIKELRPVKTLKADAKGRFCIKSLSNGIYVAKIGTGQNLGTECPRVLFRINKRTKINLRTNLEIAIPLGI